MLIQMRFGLKMRTSLMWCVKSASISILVNGSPTIPFDLQKGLREEDSISPFLFIMSEALNFMIREAKEKGLIKRVCIGKDIIELMHLQFTDDTIIFLPQEDNVVLYYRKLID